MTADWDFYTARVDGDLASIFVDLGLEHDAPLAGLPQMAYVRLHMNQPRADGLSSREEYDTLIDIEKALEAGLCDDRVRYVGRNTSGGCRDFYFYAASAGDWDAKVEKVLAPFNGYRHRSGTRDDAEWSSYLNFLLPGHLDRQKIQNRRVCDVLERHGDPLTAEREIDHWIYFPTVAAVDDCIAELTPAGFQVRNRSVGDEGALRFGLQLWRVDVPSHQNINDVTLQLVDAAQRHGGDYDGWECPVEA